MGGIRRPVTWIIPYYKNRTMLERHIDYYKTYSKEILQAYTWIFVDDGSPKEHRPDDILAAAPDEIRARIRLLRILDDRPWNQHGARNLGAKLAETRWLFMTDMDRCLTAYDARRLLERDLNPARWYKPVSLIPNKDFPLSSPKLPCNQFLCSKKQFWFPGGYDEDYCGTYGGDVSFMKQIEKRYPLEIMPDVRLIRYNSDIIPGSETEGLSRKEYTEKFKALKAIKVASGNTQAINPIRFPWKEIKI